MIHLFILLSLFLSGTQSIDVSTFIVTLFLVTFTYWSATAGLYSDLYLPSRESINVNFFLFYTYIFYPFYFVYFEFLI